MTIQVDCINKEPRYNSHEAIDHLGGPQPNGNGRWRMTRLEVVQWIEQGHNFFTKDKYGNIAYLQVKTSLAGNKYVETKPDGRPGNNLLNLTECPIR